MHRAILIALDGAPRNRALLDTALRYAQPDRHVLRVLMAVDVAYALSPGDTAQRREYPAASEEGLHARRALSLALAHLRERGVDAEGTLLAGDPASVILAEARRIGCELIVMGHRHLSRVGRLLDPSVSAEVLDRSPCPVLIAACPA